MPELNGRKVFETREFLRCPSCSTRVQLDLYDRIKEQETADRNHRRLPSDLPIDPASEPESIELPYPLDPEKRILKLYAECRNCGNLWMFKRFIISAITELPDSPGKPSPAKQAMVEENKEKSE